MRIIYSSIRHGVDQNHTRRGLLPLRRICSPSVCGWNRCSKRRETRTAPPKDIKNRFEAVREIAGDLPLKRHSVLNAYPFTIFGNYALDTDMVAVVK
jgi:hypothetical protein